MRESKVEGKCDMRNGKLDCREGKGRAMRWVWRICLFINYCSLNASEKLENNIFVCLNNVRVCQSAVTTANFPSTFSRDRYKVHLFLLLLTFCFPNFQCMRQQLAVIFKFESWISLLLLWKLGFRSILLSIKAKIFEIKHICFAHLLTLRFISIVQFINLPIIYVVFS